MRNCSFNSVLFTNMHVGTINESLKHRDNLLILSHPRLTHLYVLECTYASPALCETAESHMANFGLLYNGPRGPQTSTPLLWLHLLIFFDGSLEAHIVSATRSYLFERSALPVIASVWCVHQKKVTVKGNFLKTTWTTSRAYKKAIRRRPWTTYVDKELASLFKES